jgi:hypothetical protein
LDKKDPLYPKKDTTSQNMVIQIIFPVVLFFFLPTLSLTPLLKRGFLTTDAAGFEPRDA